MNLHSDRVPDIPKAPSIGDLFANLYHNWDILTPVLSILFGVLFGSWLIMKVYKHVRGSD